MPRLLDLLSPTRNRDRHSAVTDLIKHIISVAAPAPTAGLSDGLSNGPASNRIARELAHRDSIAKLVGYMLTEFPSPIDSLSTERTDASDPSPPKLFLDVDSATSSVVQSICIMIELIRQNNSDYFEPYLFHTLRNRLIQVQQQLQMHTQDGREILERAMTEMVNRMGVVHLGPVLEIMCDKLDILQRYLRGPRSAVGSMFLNEQSMLVDNITLCNSMIQCLPQSEL